MDTKVIDAGSLMDAVFLHAAVGLAVADMEGRCIRANPALERMLGVGLGELAGALVESMIPASDPEEAMALMEELLAGGVDSYRLEKHYQHKNGEKIWLRVTASLLRDA